MDRIDIARLIDSERRQIRDDIVGLSLKQPFWQQRFGFAITERLMLDVDTLLEALAKSVRHGAPMLVADQMRWQRNQLQGIGCATGHMREIATCMWNVISARMPEPALSAISAPIQAALDGLSYAGVAQSIGALQAEVAAALVAETFDLHWHWQAAYGPAGRDMAQYEAWFFIDYVIDALGSDRPDILRQELIWRRRDLTERGLSTLHVRQLAWLLDQTVAARLPAGAAAMRQVMELALSAIDDTAEGSLALLGAQERIVAEVAQQLIAAGLGQHDDQTPAEVGWYLAYLADSIAAGSPGPLSGYTRRVRQHLESQGLPDALIRHVYGALCAAVERYLPQPAAREASAILQAASRL
jgi:hypothetical protein